MSTDILNKKLGFGRYKNRTLLSLWAGNNSQVDREMIKQYLDDFIGFLFNRIPREQKLLINNYSPTSEEYLLIEQLREMPELFDSIKISGFLIQFTSKVNLELFEKIKSLLLNMFNYSPFRSPFFNAWGDSSLQDEKLSEIEYTQGSQLLVNTIPDHSYLKWLFENHDDYNFYLDWEDLFNGIPSIYPAISMYSSSENTISYEILVKIDYNRN